MSKCCIKMYFFIIANAPFPRNVVKVIIQESSDGNLDKLFQLCTSVKTKYCGYLCTYTTPIKLLIEHMPGTLLCITCTCNDEC